MGDTEEKGEREEGGRKGGGREGDRGRGRKACHQGPVALA